MAGTVSLSGGLLTLGFPSLGTLGLVSPTTAPEVFKRPGGDLKLYGPQADPECGKTDRKGNQAAGYTKTMPATYGSLRYTEAQPAKKPELKPESVVRTTTIVAAADGTGQVSVGLDFDLGNPARQMLVWAENAEITATSSGQLDALGRVRVEKPGYVTLTLRNLSPGTKVEVKGAIVGDKGATEAAKSFGVPVVVAAPKPAGREGG